MCEKCRSLGRMCSKCVDEFVSLKRDVTTHLTTIENIIKKLQYERECLEEAKREFRQFFISHKGIPLPPRASLKRMVDYLLSGEDVDLLEFRLVHQTRKLVIDASLAGTAHVKALKSYVSRYDSSVRLSLCETRGFRFCVVIFPISYSKNSLSRYVKVDLENIFVVRSIYESFSHTAATLCEDHEFNLKYVAWAKVLDLYHGADSMRRFLREYEQGGICEGKKV